MKLVNLPESPVTLRNLIGGEWQAPVDGKYQDVISPYTGTKIGSVPMSGARDVDAAVQAARAAAQDWQRVPIKERTQTLFRFRQLLLDRLEELGHWAARESGKTVDEGKAGVLKGVEIIEYALSVQNMDQGAALEVSRGVFAELKREPLGVVAGIAPFNFPAMVPMWMYPIAITLGNAFVLKPSEKVPMTSELVGKLVLEAGYPRGVFSVVHGGRDVVEALCDHPDIAALGFVGSTPVAKAVYSRATATGKRALCLGGAKNPLIVVPDADPDVTIDGVVRSFTGCAGQRCMAASLLVAVGNCDKLIDGIVEHARKIVLGKDMGALIDQAAYERLQRDIQKAKDDGVDLRLDGRNPKKPQGYEGGYWLGASIFDRAHPEMECSRKELFGPMVTIVRVKSLDEALAIQDGNPYGNATSIFTTRGATARYVAENAKAGMIGVNIGVPVPREPFSFGGIKGSRFGAGDITGQGAVDFWSHQKKITSKWALQPDQSWMS